MAKRVAVFLGNVAVAVLFAPLWAVAVFFSPMSKDFDTFARGYEEAFRNSFFWQR